MNWSIVAAFAVPLVLSWILVRCHIMFAFRWGLIDMPSDRKFHRNPTPTGAGLAIYLAMTCTATFWSFFGGQEWVGNVQLLMAGLIVLFGLLDDHRTLPWQLRLAVHVLTAVVAVRYALPDLGGLLLVAAVLWIVVLINAFNVVDNMDGLCTGVAWIIGACLVAALLPDHSFSVQSEGLGITPFHLVTLLGALAAFFWFNRPPARVFLGDTGSTFLGFILAVACLPLLFSKSEVRSVSVNWIVPICLMALPIYDLASVLFLRWWQGRGLFVSDRNNLSHRLVATGLTPQRAVALLWLLNLVSSIGGLVLLNVTVPMKLALGVAHLSCWWIGLPLVERYLSARRKKLRY
jgi:UDP-GlcNAc:undecaprenyl-phosphate GlcNAc-1-phosphate transferase